MRGLIITHGSIVNFDYYKNLNYDFCVCADGGIEYAKKLGLIPDVIVGDFDSCNREVLKFFEEKGVSIDRYPREKDFTDTQLAVKIALEKGCDDILIIGAIGNRLDHTITNIHILVYLLEKGIKGTIINENNRIFIINKNTVIHGHKGDLISFLPFGGPADGLKSDGLYYPLPEKMDIYEPCGVSNIFTGDKAAVSIKSGFLLVIIPKE